MYDSILVMNMLTSLLTVYVMLTIVMVMSRGVVSYVICMFYVLCKMIIIININKLIYFSYIDTIISVYGIMLIDNNITNTIIMSFFRFEALLIL